MLIHMASFPDLASRLSRVESGIAQACKAAGRDRAEISLMAVTKFLPPEAILESYALGLRLFGESRAQEARDKLPSLIESLPEARFHFIGPLQSNKAKLACELFSCVQSLGSEPLLLELDRRARAAGKKLDVLLELHTAEDSKGGFESEDALLSALALAESLGGLNVRGLMTMAPYVQDEAPVRASFARSRALFERCRAETGRADLDTLSMGMTNDYLIAVEEGSTLLRLGSALFAQRQSTLGEGR
jgi:PLP dependent protein